MNKLKSFFQESYVEMRHKVSWPKYSDLQSSSVLVLVASLIFALMIGVIDMGFDNAMDWFYTINK
ncbi:MAG: preprotein translocase subunit SecE [Roseivirga sp.]|nr:preprotein translocase subunit SecE [Roseivirga sp.]